MIRIVRAWLRRKVPTRSVIVGGYVGDNHVHVIPLGDTVVHELDDCVCGPAVEFHERCDGSDGWLVVHHALDGRR